jgi:hypothetical protein
MVCIMVMFFTWLVCDSLKYSSSRKAITKEYTAMATISGMSLRNVSPLCTWKINENHSLGLYDIILCYFSVFNKFNV